VIVAQTGSYLLQLLALAPVAYVLDNSNIYISPNLNRDQPNSKKNILLDMVTEVSQSKHITMVIFLQGKSCPIIPFPLPCSSSHMQGKDLSKETLK